MIDNKLFINKGKRAKGGPGVISMVILRKLPLHAPWGPTGSFPADHWGKGSNERGDGHMHNKVVMNTESASVSAQPGQQ